MKNSLLLLLVIISSFIFFQCNDQILESQKKPALQLTETEKKIASSSEEFGLELIRKMDAFEAQKNIFISPLSISYALGMTLNGAKSSTYSSIRDVMGLNNLSQEDINYSFLSLTNSLSGIDPKVTFQIANSIWYKTGFEVEPPFLSSNKEFFDAFIKDLNFADPVAAGIINQWVNDKTKGKISEIIDSPIPSDAIMYVINALYFKGIWTYKFDPNNSYDGLFELYDHTTITAKYMVQENKFRMYDGQSFSSIEIPYGENTFSMVVLLPDEDKDLPSIINSLTSDGVKNIFDNAVETEAKLVLPRFMLKYEIELKDILTQLGMGAAFDPFQADFTGINKDGGIFISRVKHKTFVNVDEEGTEAAAVTSIEFKRTSLGDSFIVNRPFLFFIKENTTNTVLFTGVIYEPKLQAD